MKKIKPDMIAEKGAAIVLQSCVDQVAGGRIAVLETAALEGPHQLRIGLRRLRTALTFFRPAIDSYKAREIANEARWLGKEVGRIRDFEVVAHDIRKMANGNDEEARSDGTPFVGLSAIILQERARLRDLLQDARASEFERSLASFLSQRGWLIPTDFDQTRRLAQPLGKLAERTLKHRWGRTRKAGRNLNMHTVEERHAFRKELKKLRYSVEFALPLLPGKAATKFLKRLRRLQDVYGSLNDVAVARRVLAAQSKCGERSSDHRERVSSPLAELERHATQEFNSANHLWRKLEGTTRPWK